MSDFITVAELRIEAERLCDENERLEAENAKLREEIEAAKHDLQVFSMGSVQLEAENAKLRKLVRELWRTMDLLNACDVSEYDEPLNCIYCEQWGTVGKNIVGCKLKYRMCELGVDA